MVVRQALLDHSEVDMKNNADASTKRRHLNPLLREIEHTNQNTLETTVWITCHPKKVSTRSLAYRRATTCLFKIAPITSPHRATTATTNLIGRHPQCTMMSMVNQSTSLCACVAITANLVRTWASIARLVLRVMSHTTTSTCTHVHLRSDTTVDPKNTYTMKIESGSVRYLDGPPQRLSRRNRALNRCSQASRSKWPRLHRFLKVHD
jgi:hypothetical protein